MGRYLTALALVLSLAAAALEAQDFKAGDLMPRNGIIAYFTSDRPDVFYRLFGKDEKGEYRLKSLFNAKAAGEADPEKAAAAKAAGELIFGNYEKAAGFEMGFLDVTMGGAKYLLHLRPKHNQSFDVGNKVLDGMLKEVKKVHGYEVRVYEMPSKGEKPKVPGFEYFYIVRANGGLVISNFESTITDALQRLASEDFSESLSSRPEFKAWRENRKEHDLSLFIVGRELQAAVERMLPSKDQAKRDLPGAYSALDGWLQLREYKSIVLDFDYDDTKGAVDIEIQLNTQRRTRLLEKLAIEPAEFKHLSYLPANVTLLAGMQLGDAPTTYQNLVEFARDAEKAAKLAKKEGPKPPPGPDGEEAPPVMAKPTLDEMLAKLDKNLGQMGASVKDIVATLGTEIIVFCIGDATRAIAKGSAKPDEFFRAGRMGAIVGLRDAKAARALFDKVREKDTEGLGKLPTTEHDGVTIYGGGADKKFGFAFTDNALLLVTAPSSDEQGANILADLKSMLDGRRKARSFDPSITRCSKFITVRVGEIAAMAKAAQLAGSQMLDRNAKPMMGNEWFEMFGKTSVTIRLNESKDGIALGLRVVGLPPLGNALELTPISGAAGKGAETSGAWGYAQSNARELAGGLRSFVNSHDKTTLTLEAALKDGSIRQANLQSPFDKSWKGGAAKLKHFSIRFAKRDADGNLPKWVDAEAFQVVETNEKAGFTSFTLAEGADADIRQYKSGRIVAYQSKPDAFGGRVVIYGDDFVGWLSDSAFTKALELNKKGEDVPDAMGRNPFKDEKGPGPRRAPTPRDEDDPWAPGGRDNKKGEKGREDDGISRPNDKKGEK